MRITFIGGGIMAEAILGGILDGGIARAGDVRFGEPVQVRRDYLTKQYGVDAVAANADAVKDADIVVMAVKPQHLGGVMGELKGKLQPGQAVMSIVAGATLDTLTKGLGHDAVIRVMPNTPAQIRQGMSVWIASPSVTDAQRETAKNILASTGEELQVNDEKYMDMVTALSGSGPAYVFLFIEALIDAGVYMGLQRDIARKLALQTVLGSTKYVMETGKHPAELKDAVSSPAGGTVEALMTFEKGRFRGVVLEAVAAAYDKYRDLGKQR